MNTFPSVDEVVKSDAFPTAIWQLEPHREGTLPVASGRGGPINIHWEVHGEGPVKLVVRGYPKNLFFPDTYEKRWYKSLALSVYLYILAA